MSVSGWWVRSGQGEDVAGLRKIRRAGVQGLNNGTGTREAGQSYLYNKGTFLAHRPSRPWRFLVHHGRATRTMCRRTGCAERRGIRPDVSSGKGSRARKFVDRTLYG